MLSQDESCQKLEGALNQILPPVPSRPCQHLDATLPVSRTTRRQVSVVLSHLLCGTSLFCFSAAPRGLSDLSSPTRDGTRTLSSQCVES